MKLFSVKVTGQKLLAAGVAGASAVLFAHEQAQAQTMLPTQSNYNLDRIVSGLGNQVKNIPDLIFTFSYIAGAAFAAFGIISMKKHIDNPANEPLKNGLGRLAAGGALLTVPTVSDIMVNTLGLGGEQAATQQGFGNEFVPMGSQAPVKK